MKKNKKIKNKQKVKKVPKRLKSSQKVKNYMKTAQKSLKWINKTLLATDGRTDRRDRRSDLGYI